MKALEMLMGSILSTKPKKKDRLSKWEKAFKSGFSNGYNRTEKLPPPCYRKPKITSLAWENGYAWGEAEKVKEENKGIGIGELNVRLRTGNG